MWGRWPQQPYRTSKTTRSNTEWPSRFSETRPHSGTLSVWEDSAYHLSSVPSPSLWSSRKCSGLHPLGSFQTCPFNGDSCCFCGGTRGIRVAVRFMYRTPVKGFEAVSSVRWALEDNLPKWNLHQEITYNLYPLWSWFSFANTVPAWRNSFTRSKANGSSNQQQLYNIVVVNKNSSSQIGMKNSSRNKNTWFTRISFHSF